MFEPAQQTTKGRTKLFVYGASGTGKTTLALQFPKVAMIDMERGSTHYADDYDFGVLHCTNSDAVSQAVDMLAKGNHPYQTVVIDPFTVYWEALLQKWTEIFLRRNQMGRGHHQEYYSFQLKDWSTVKGDMRDMLRRLLGLDMNVVMTAREKPVFDENGTAQQMPAHDGEKSIPYLFDVVLRLRRVDDNRIAEVVKDRGGALGSNLLEAPSAHALYERITSAYGSLTSDSTAQPSEPLASEDQLEKIGKLTENFAPEQLQLGLANYRVSTFAELTENQASIVIQHLQGAQK